MKKILLAVTAALAITSCSQNEEFENEGQKAEINAPAKGLQDLQDGNRVILRSAEFLKALDTLEDLHVVVGDGLVMFGLCFERSDFVLIENDWCFGF